ncbi:MULTISPECIES: hypothetical protein [Streptomyces]|uniref:Uncharacterized protein n=1 Tax=Streptomyces mirabilis TaxID=68239 RepID=A0ABU3UIG3_9ACTN|nr:MULTISPECIES: hypothetical protein [Streptomyces]MCX4612972.1 hypothetical protein [Streptomyces mirabilis]MCX5353103.1 hypothetical protein [Streptomyces mirabilis]MDU8993324.1 hypothetical protein [Streptomyces mirabilis]
MIRTSSAGRPSSSSRAVGCAICSLIAAACEAISRSRWFRRAAPGAFGRDVGGAAAKALETRRTGAYNGFLEPIDRAKGTGHLRDDFTSQDLVVLLMANAGVVNATGDAAPDTWRRLVAHMLRSYAAPGAPPPRYPTHPRRPRCIARWSASAGPACPDLWLHALRTRRMRRRPGARPSDRAATEHAAARSGFERHAAGWPVGCQWLKTSSAWSRRVVCSSQ